MFSPSMLVRIVRRTAGRPRIALRVRPSVDYGRARAETRCGAHHISYVGSAQAMRLTTDLFTWVSEWQRGEPGSMPANVTLISGPSKTADIEQTLAVGVHGPKRLIVLLYEDG